MPKITVWSLTVKPKLARPPTILLVAWQSSIDRLIRIDSPSRNEWWFEEKEIPHG
jgi:hypothetical protein